MTEPLELSQTLMQRRRLITHGAAVAGAAAGAVALSVAGAAPASAVDGQTLTQGGTFNAGSTTTLGGGSSSTATLRLSNPSGGPQLYLSPVADSFTGALAPGQLVATRGEILVGLSDAGTSYTTSLATADTANLTLAVPSERLLDTRTAEGREGIRGIGGKGLDSAGRINGQGFVDVFVAPANAVLLDGVFLNLTSTGSTGNGFLFAYPPIDPRPVGSTTSFQKGVTIASSCICAVGVVDGAWVARVYSSATSHAIVDLTGVLLASAAPSGAVNKQARGARRPASRRLRAWRPTVRR